MCIWICTIYNNNEEENDGEIVMEDIGSELSKEAYDYDSETE